MEEISRLSTEEQKAIMAQLTDMMKEKKITKQATRQQLARKLKTQIPEGVNQSIIKYIEKYPHYIPQGFTQQDIIYDKQWGQYMICRDREPLLVYIPIHDLDIGLFIQQYQNVDGPYNEHIRERHENFINTLRNRPLIKGVWIVSAYPTISYDEKVEILSSDGEEMFFMDFDDASGCIEEIEDNFPEYQVLSRSIYYSLVAYVIQQYYNNFRYGGVVYSSSNFSIYRYQLDSCKIYMSFLLGRDGMEYKVAMDVEDNYDDCYERMRKKMLNPTRCEMHKNEGFSLIGSTLYTGILYMEDYNCSQFLFFRGPLCGATCNIPLAGPYAIIVKDEVSDELIMVKTGAVAFAEYMPSRYSFNTIGLLEEMSEQLPGHYYKKTCIFMVKEP